MSAKIMLNNKKCKVLEGLSITLAAFSPSNPTHCISKIIVSVVHHHSSSSNPTTDVKRQRLLTRLSSFIFILRHVLKRAESNSRES